jgi:two-component system cell cycle response regulator DivK
MSKRILVVEDQEDNRQIVRDLLTANDYEMTEAENGEEALAAVAKDRPDLILMDIQLPVMDGYEATRRITMSSHAGGVPQSHPIAKTPESLREADAGCKASVRNHCSPPLGLSLRLAAFGTKFE